MNFQAHSEQELGSYIPVSTVDSMIAALRSYTIARTFPKRIRT